MGNDIDTNDIDTNDGAGDDATIPADELRSRREANVLAQRVTLHLLEAATAFERARGMGRDQGELLREVVRGIPAPHGEILLEGGILKAMNPIISGLRVSLRRGTQEEMEEAIREAVATEPDSDVHQAVESFFAVDAAPNPPSRTVSALRTLLAERPALECAILLHGRADLLLGTLSRMPHGELRITVNIAVGEFGRTNDAVADYYFDDEDVLSFAVRRVE
jgi:hypothetical protein